MTCPRSYDASRQTPLRQCRFTDFFSHPPPSFGEGAFRPLLSLCLTYHLSSSSLCCHYLSLSLSLSTYTSIHLYFIQSYNHISFISHLDCRIPNPPCPSNLQRISCFFATLPLVPAGLNRSTLCFATRFFSGTDTTNPFNVQCSDRPRPLFLRTSIFNTAM